MRYQVENVITFALTQVFWCINSQTVTFLGFHFRTINEGSTKI